MHFKEIYIIAQPHFLICNLIPKEDTKIELIAQRKENLTLETYYQALCTCFLIRRAAPGLTPLITQNRLQGNTLIKPLLS